MIHSMHKIDQATLEKYRKLISQDPNSQVFAPFAEGLRERGLLAEAEKYARNGIKRHPGFPGGYVVLGKILKDQKKNEEAISTFRHVIQIDNENLLAYQFLGDLALESSLPKEALKYYKMVLFLNPQSSKAQKVVKKLESLSADEYEAEVFQMTPLKPQRPAESKLELAAVPAESSNPSWTPNKGLQRMLSLIDAFIVRNDLDKAQELLADTEAEFGADPEILQRRKVLFNRQSSQLNNEDESPEPLMPIMSRENAIREKKLRVLRAVLGVIDRAQV